MCGHAIPKIRRKIIRHFIGNHTGKGGVRNCASVTRFMASVTVPHGVVVVIHTNDTISRLVRRLFPRLSRKSVLVSNNGSGCRSAGQHITLTRGGNFHFIKTKISNKRRKTLGNTSVVPKKSRDT